MDMYSAVDGEPSDFHLVHLGSRALGGAALVMTEMLCVSAAGRITPGCAGIYSESHVAAWRRIVDFAHSSSGCAVGAQLGHCGRQGSTKLMWEGIDEPLPDGNWEVIAASPIPYAARNQVPRAMTRADMDAVLAEFVWAVHGAVAAQDSTSRNCMRARVPAVVVPLAVVECAGGRLRRIVGRASSVPVGGGSMHAARPGLTISR